MYAYAIYGITLPRIYVLIITTVTYVLPKLGLQYKINHNHYTHGTVHGIKGFTIS